jgi:hypothetical protein
MNWRSIVNALAVTTFALPLLSGSAWSQDKSAKEQLIGAWTLISNENTLPDGTKRQLFGPNPKGILILDASGRYVQMQVRSDRPKFKVNNRLEGTPEENRAVVQATVAIFGNWSVDETSKTLVMTLETSLFPNQEGEESRRPFSVSGDELRWSAPSPGAGGRSESVYRRIK